MNEKKRKTLLDLQSYLQDIVDTDDVKDVLHNIDVGLCENIDAELLVKNDACLPSDLMQEDILKFWPLYSGDEVFPIEGGKNQYYASQKNDGLWKGKQLEHRLDFCKFLINHIDNLL